MCLYPSLSPYRVVLYGRMEDVANDILPNQRQRYKAAKVAPQKTMSKARSMILERVGLGDGSLRKRTILACHEEQVSSKYCRHWASEMKGRGCWKWTSPGRLRSSSG